MPRSSNELDLLSFEKITLKRHNTRCITCWVTVDSADRLRPSITMKNRTWSTCTWNCGHWYRWVGYSSPVDCIIFNSRLKLRQCKTCKGVWVRVVMIYPHENIHHWKLIDVLKILDINAKMDSFV